MQSILLQAVSLQDLRCIQQKNTNGFSKHPGIFNHRKGLRGDRGENRLLSLPYGLFPSFPLAEAPVLFVWAFTWESHLFYQRALFFHG